MSKSTWSARRRAARAILGPQLTPISLQQFRRKALRHLTQLLNRSLKPDTISKEIAHIRWIAMAMGFGPLPSSFAIELGLLQRGLRHQQAFVKKSKALPMSKHMLRHIAKRAPLPIAVALLLAFHTASRVNDILRLTPDSFVVSKNRTSLLILFGVTKTNQTAESRGDHQMILSPIPSLLRKHALSLHAIMKTVSSQSITSFLRGITPPTAYVARYQAMNPTTIVRQHFTQHSLKRGAAERLWLQASRSKTTVEMVLHRLKHKSLEASLAYAPNPLTAAKAIELSKTGKSMSAPPSRARVRSKKAK